MSSLCPTDYLHVPYVHPQVSTTQPHTPTLTLFTFNHFYTLTTDTLHVHQWWTLPFMMREYNFILHEHGLISITSCWMTDIHIPFTQFNVTSIGLGYYMILKCSLYPSWGCYNLAYEWSSQRRCRQVETKIWDDRQWHMDRHWHIQ